MTGNHADFARQLAALADRLARVSTELAAAGRGLIERRLLPPEALADELAGIRTDFEDLRTRVLDAAAAMSLGPTPPVTTVRELEVLLRVVTETESRRARRAQAEKSPAAEDPRRQADQEVRRRGEEEQARRKAEDAKRQAADEARKRAAEAEERARQMEQERREAEAAARQAEEQAQQARRRAEEEAKRQAEEHARRRAEEEARRKADEEDRRRDQDARRRAEEDARVPATAEAVAEAEEADLGLETAQWWISANASWTSIKSRQISFAEAVHDVLLKYPYVFSVPIQTSADYEDGLLAYGYAVLLDYVEQRSAGFVSEALNRLPARKGTSLGRRLYEYLAEPLRPAFGEFIRAVMMAALPKTALWVTGGIEDSEQATTVFVRPSGRVGDPTQKAERFTQDPRRFADHQFTTSVAPLTARFFRVEAAEVKEPRTVEVRLDENGAASDHAWIVMTSTRNPTQSRRHDRKGTTVAGVGRDYSGVWVGLFNADAETERRFDLTIGLKRRAATAAFQKK